METIIQAQDLVKKYGDFIAVNGISFRVESSECFGILGQNGAGKSTTMRMIYGVSRVSSGVLEVLGEKVNLTPPYIKALLGVVPQEDNLDPELSVLDNLLVYASYYGIPQEIAKKRALEWLDFMQLKEKIGAEVDKLSGGQKRRLVIARALINLPKLLILDEPTTGLDPQARHMVWAKLEQLKQKGITLLLTTHYMEEADRLCDRLVIMDNGKILAQGAPRDLIRDYVAPDVIEIRKGEMSLPQGWLEMAKERKTEVEKVGDILYLFSHQGEKLFSDLVSMGFSPREGYLRRATLEDVFLRLTGRELME